MKQRRPENMAGGFLTFGGNSATELKEIIAELGIGAYGIANGVFFLPSQRAKKIEYIVCDSDAILPPSVKIRKPTTEEAVLLGRKLYRQGPKSWLESRYLFICDDDCRMAVVTDKNFIGGGFYAPTHIGDYLHKKVFIVAE